MANHIRADANCLSSLTSNFYRVWCFMPQELYSLNAINLSASYQLLLHIALMWIGWGTVIGLAVRRLVPWQQPLGVWETLLVGLVGSMVGLAAWVWILDIDVATFHPMSVAGGVASLGGGILTRIVWRLLFAPFVTEKPDAQLLSAAAIASALSPITNRTPHTSAML